MTNTVLLQATIDHELIKSWAQRRGARPFTMQGKEHPWPLFFESGTIRPGLVEIDWSTFFDEFEQAQLAFVSPVSGPNREVDDTHEFVKRASLPELTIRANRSSWSGRCNANGPLSVSLWRGLPVKIFHHSPPGDQSHGTSAIHVVPDDAFEDWIVRDEEGRELGRYATSDTAALAAEAIARQRQGKLVIRRPDGSTQCKSFAKGWLARLLAE